MTPILSGDDDAYKNRVAACPSLYRRPTNCGRLSCQIGSPQIKEMP